MDEDLQRPPMWRAALHALGRPLRRFRYKRFRKRLDQARSAADVFSEIYEGNYWDTAESRSGAGSTLANTEKIRREIEKIVRDLDIKTVLDAPCGDFNWMRLVTLGDDVRYIGGDIVPALIADVSRRHAAPGRNFLVLDICEGPMPEHDLWICRDCLFHLSYRDAARALNAFLASTGRFALLTTHLPDPNDPFVNRDIATGDARRIDLLAPPYRLPEPLSRHDDWTPPSAPRQLGLWSKDQIAQHAEAFIRAHA